MKKFLVLVVMAFLTLMVSSIVYAEPMGVSAPSITPATVPDGQTITVSFQASFGTVTPGNTGRTAVCLYVPDSWVDVTPSLSTSGVGTWSYQATADCDAVSGFDVYEFHSAAQQTSGSTTFTISDIRGDGSGGTIASRQVDDCTGFDTCPDTQKTLFSGSSAALIAYAAAAESSCGNSPCYVGSTALADIIDEGTATTIRIIGTNVVPVEGIDIGTRILEAESSGAALQSAGLKTDAMIRTTTGTIRDLIIDGNGQLGGYALIEVSGSAIIENNAIKNNGSGSGIEVSSAGNPDIKFNHIIDNYSFGVDVTGTAGPNIEDNNIYGNNDADDGFGNTPQVNSNTTSGTISADHNYWGLDASGSTIGGSNFGANDWAHRLGGNIMVESPGVNAYESNATSFSYKGMVVTNSEEHTITIVDYGTNYAPYGEGQGGDEGSQCSRYYEVYVDVDNGADTFDVAIDYHGAGIAASCLNNVENAANPPLWYLPLDSSGTPGALRWEIGDDATTNAAPNTITTVIDDDSDEPSFSRAAGVGLPLVIGNADSPTAVSLQTVTADNNSTAVGIGFVVLMLAGATFVMFRRREVA